MTKADIVNAVYTRLGGFSKKESADLVDDVFETMKETLARGEKIKISGFGNFVLRDKRQRQGRNPQTGEPIVITERRVLNFKASQLLKQALNEEDEAAVAVPASNGASGSSVAAGSGDGSGLGSPSSAGSSSAGSSSAGAAGAGSSGAASAGHTSEVQPAAKSVVSDAGTKSA